ncbi:oxygenase MpaB family protein [Croceibacterium sp. TMG7-5b_MA50]|uniref:oxygenase MpaB family protein n=1 Tax=Croceibacterium sp. TMG7-5b_MA50 TaxID=3121290 RepID=UPI0032215B99
MRDGSALATLRRQPWHPAEQMRRQLGRSVRQMFNDPGRGEAPVIPSADALFAPDTPIRMVHADVTSMMVGGVAALLLQMLHPHALQGVLDHSDFRHDLDRRLRRTARFVAVTTYGPAADAARAIERVNAIHRHINGTLPDGTPYSATDPATLAWVHLAEAWSFLNAYVTLVRPDMPGGEQDEYYRQFAVLARLLGAAPVPESRAQAAELMAAMRPALSAGPAPRQVAQVVLNHRGSTISAMAQPVLTQAAVDLLPPFARTMLGLRSSPLPAISTRLATRMLGGTIRWALRPA